MRDLESAMKLPEMRKLLDRTPGGYRVFASNPKAGLVKLNNYIDSLLAEIEDGRKEEDIPAG